MTCLSRLFIPLALAPPLAAAPLVYQALPDLALPPLTEPDARNLSQAIDARGKSSFLLQTGDASDGNIQFDLWTHGAWHSLPSSTSFAPLNTSTVKTRLIAGPDGTLTSLFAFNGVITGLYGVEWTPSGGVGPLQGIGVSGNFGLLDATALSDGTIAIATTFPGDRQISVAIWDGNSIVESFMTTEDPDGYFDRLTVAETSTGGVAVAAWNAVEDAGTRTRTLRYLSSARPLSATPSWSTVYSNSEPASEINFSSVADLAMQNTTLPFIAHSNSIDDTVMVSRFTIGSGWVHDTVDASPARTAPFRAYLDDQDRPAVAWTPYGTFQPRSAARNGSSWESPQVLNGISSSVGAFAVDADGFLHLSGVNESDDTIESLSPLDTTDLDGDGIVYLLEDALQSDPNDASSRELPQFDVTASDRMALSFEVPGDTTKLNGTENGILFSASENLIFNIQLSNELESWSQSSALLDTDLFTLGGRRVVVAEQVSPIGDGARKYMRLEVLRLR